MSIVEKYINYVKNEAMKSRKKAGIKSFWAIKLTNG